MNINDLLHIMIEKKASDLHLKEGRPPLLRIDGKLTPLDMEILSRADLREIVYTISDEKLRKKFEESNEMDLAYNLEGVARFRANVFKQMGKLEIVMRAIPIKIPTIEELNLPKILNEIALYPRGLVLVTGATGSGKSTTLAAMINKINENYAHHIVTIEDPIEFVHTDKKSSISQREIGLDTESFASALRYVLRQDPDVILIGEMRDAETVSIALTAAETGHMVFSTLHTIDTIQSINRILDFFPKEEQHQVSLQLAGVLKAVVSLRLVTRKDGGRVPAVEVMVVTPAIRSYIEENKISSIKDLIKDGVQWGMQTFDQSLINLYKQGLISIEEAKKNATSPQEIDLALKGITSSRASAQSILDSMLKEQAKKELDKKIKDAKNLLDEGRTKEAYTLLESLKEKYPEDKQILELFEKSKRMLNVAQFQQTIKTIILEGLNIYKRGNIKGAIVKWQEGLKIDPDNVQLKKYIQDAKRKLEEISNIPKILEEGVALYKEGKIDLAIKKWEEVLKVDPSNKHALSYIEGAKQKLKEIAIKKEFVSLYKKGVESAENGDELKALFYFNRALNIKPDNKDAKEAFDTVYEKLASEEFGGGDVESAITKEAFEKGLKKFLEGDYIGTIKEWKKAIEKRPLEKKLKSYVENVKLILKNLLEEYIEKAEDAYNSNKLGDALFYINKILNIDSTNEYALKFKKDIMPAVMKRSQELYKEAMDLYADSKLKEAKEKLEEVLKLDDKNITARKRLEEIISRLEKLKDI